MPNRKKPKPVNLQPDDAVSASVAEKPAALGGTPRTSMAEKIGGVEATLDRYPLGELLDLLSEPMLARVGALQSHRLVQDRQNAVRVTEGRTFPVILTRAGDGTLAFFDGAETLAAAINLDLPKLYAFVVGASDAGAVQSALGAFNRQIRDEDEDDLIFRVHADDDSPA